MPELPDVAVYVERLDALLLGREISGWRCVSPSLVKTYDPPAREMVGKRVTGVRRIGKRIVLGLEGELFVVLHLMIAGRLLKDRALSRLLHEDWPASLDEQ